MLKLDFCPKIETLLNLKGKSHTVLRFIQR